MSVVNKMLRDLEDREQIKSFSPHSANYITPKSSKGLWFAVLCFGLFSVMAASYSAYLISQAPVDDRIKQSPDGNHIQKGDQYALQESSEAPKKEVAKAQLPPVVANAIEPKPNMPSIANVIASDSPKVALVDPKTSFSVSPSDGAKSQLSSLRAKAYLASQKNDDVSVTKLLQEILLLAPQELKTRKQLAAKLFSANQLIEAKDLLTEGILQAPADSSLRLMLSRIFYRLGDHKQAYTVLSQHPYSALANDELVSFRAALAEKTGNYNLAQQDYLLLVQRNPNDAKWWLGLGVSQDKQKLSDDAISSYKHAQSLNQLPQQVNTFVAKRIQLLASSS